MPAWLQCCSGSCFCCLQRYCLGAQYWDTEVQKDSHGMKHQRSFISSLILKQLKFDYPETWNKPRHLENTVTCGLLNHTIAGIETIFQWKSLTINHTCPSCPSHLDLCQDQVWTHTLMKAQAMQLCTLLLPFDTWSHVSGSQMATHVKENRNHRAGC